MDHAPHPRSHWLHEALALEQPPDPVPLERHERADVCIVGGGYTGLWTAIELKTREPALDVVLIERDLCGSGASGRNAGYLLSWWAKFLSLRKICGEAEALRIARASDAVVDEIAGFCATEGIDADLREDGWLWAAANAAQRGAWQETVEAIGAHGLAPIVEWPAARAAGRCGAPGLAGGAFERHAARVQPALLARGLRRVALERGVRIHERTPLVEVKAGVPAIVETPRGRIRAERVILAMNAWAVRWAGIRKAVMVVSGDMIVTPPVPERLEAMGWRDALTVSDGRTLLEYYRTTRDGRVAFGKGGMSGTFTYGGKVGAEVEGRSDFAEPLLAALHRTLPALAGVPAERSWRGPVDRSKDGLPFFGTLGRSPNVFFGVGFSGNGIGPCRLAGRILGSLALETKDEWSTCPLVRAPTRDFPPEPFRLLGSRLIRRALLAKDRADDEGRRPSFVTRLAVSLAPAGLSPFDGPVAQPAATPEATTER
ncbi:MAG: FAD-dependent oxidoreductase [Gammaproteobacteria bacterium]|nr:FAD-dependent oxidoreductase [Gammaproteobacteria bacterium]